ncbi:CDP-diacylglycerol--serine O-phosphatidyltransferase [Azorhizobium oxalatiphilum]|uniref:CDP-diacylglycerol--serine O-phosphatidyltransferase n=1 Tax=Azorhizobium oxalatiphilum TaxID=980631 RepID=A0A917C587_9HYPH|nr:phosphatidylcholine/phosphatidylserine synthase [Azorhizobium oxalatiphilum]GGF72780.1 CDP-diacylglycerol--serine O-phosphatidyltransferase [Azorhizobium oxalatiphilum]
MSLPFPSFDPDGQPPVRPRRFTRIPLRLLLPNMVTLLALCSGLTAVRMAIEDRMELALAAIVFAALLDGVDGRLARALKGTSRFGAELDSLADFVNFGCVPALVLYLWGLDEAGSLGWIACLIFAICAALRLARFNVMLDDPDRPPFAGDFFTGIPAPAGAICVLLPVYLELLGVPHVTLSAFMALLYTIAIGLLMISKLPAWSGKTLGKRVRRELVLPLFVLFAVFAGLLASYPWLVLSLCSVFYLALLPLSTLRYRKLMAEYVASAPAKASGSTEVPADPPA